MEAVCPAYSAVEIVVASAVMSTPVPPPSAVNSAEPRLALSVVEVVAALTAAAVVLEVEEVEEVVVIRSRTTFGAGV